MDCTVQLRLLPLFAVLLTIAPVWAQGQIPGAGWPVLPPDALLTTHVNGLEQTKAAAQVIPVTGQPFSKALRVRIGAGSAETNATQANLPVPIPVAKGDALLATFFVRGAAAGGKGQAQVEFLFERAAPPWGASVSQAAISGRDARAWKRIVVPFTAATDYKVGDAMVSLRLAFGPQTVEVGGLSLVNYGKTTTAEAMQALAAQENPLGPARVTVRRADTRQTLLGLGGDFCQPRYGATEPMDAVGSYNLAHLRVAQARVGIPLNDWAPAKGVYRDAGPSHAAFLQMQMLARRKIPLIGSVWEGPAWLLPGQPEQSGRTLAPGQYADCIEAIAQFLVTARDTYGVTVDDFSFNEADYGVNFRFTPAQIAAFIRQAGPRFRALGLKTKFLAGDTTGGAPAADYARPLLADPVLAPYLGALAFHCWDALGAPDARYAAIAALGRQYHKPIWCTEAGYDAQLWQQPDAWASWENGLQTARAYAKTLRLTEASVMDYWTYQDNYPIVAKGGTDPYSVFFVIRQMQDALPAGAKIVSATSDSDDLSALTAIGPMHGQFSVLLVNPIGAGTVTLSGLPPGASVSTITHDAAAPRTPIQSQGRVSRTGSLTVPLPARSVVTVLGGSRAAP